MLEDAGFAAAEILREPIVDAGDDQPSTLDLHRSRVDELARRLVQEAIRIIGREGTWREIRAAEGRAIQYVMDPRIIPDRPQNAVFDIVQGQPFAFDGDQVL